MSYGPHAIGHADGKVIFVRGAAPDEEVDVLMREVRARYAFADLERVVTPSAARCLAPCPYLPQCGGCPWQHLDYAAQLAAKQEAVQEQLRRIAGLEVAVEPILASPQRLGYRHRLKLRVQRGRVGFLHAASHDVVPVAHCLLAPPSIDAAIVHAETLARTLRTNLRRIEIVDRGANDGGVVMVGEAEGRWNGADGSTCEQWLRDTPNVHGLVLSGRRWRHTWGDDHIVIRPESDVQLTLRAGSFTQVNPNANQLLVATVLRSAAVGPGSRVLDLFAGVGNFSIPLARRGAQVDAIEQQAAAVEDGRANAAALQLSRCVFRAETAQRAVDALGSSDAAYDVVVLDPPRSGAAEVIPGLLRLAVPRIIYVSCNPSSLARDLKLLAPRYRVDAVQPIDMFPHSYHVEIVATVKLAC
jgi:23S rRNA (uracil1939-C5)-methyltransferase